MTCDGNQSAAGVRDCDAAKTAAPAQFDDAFALRWKSAVAEVQWGEMEDGVGR